MSRKLTVREKVYGYVKRKYGSEPEYLWRRFPDYAILYKCVVTETDIPFQYSDKNVSMTALMKIRLKKRYSPERFNCERLKSEYGIFAVRGPRGIPHSLSEALKK